MSKRIIQIAPKFSLDIHRHLIERGLAILGMRGSGKSWTAGVTAEELAAIGIPFIIIDLMGEYKTLRERFPVLIVALGSPKYADIKNVTPDQATLIAEKIVKAGISVVLDLKYGTMLERFTFLAKFLEGLYHTEEKLMRPYVLIMDEAHRITPEKGVIKLREVREAQKKVEYWVYEIGATGRHYGLGFIAIARRTAEISKMTLTQCELKIVHKVVDPIDLDRLREYGLPTEYLEKVKRFNPGDAIVIGLEEPLFIHVKERICSHGAETPLARPVASPDLAKMIKSLAEVIKAPPKIAPPKPVITPEEIRELRELRILKRTYEKQIKELTTERSRLLDDIEALTARCSELERKVTITEEERSEWRKQIEALKVELDETRKTALEMEERFERLREIWKGHYDLLIETSDALGLELVPADIAELKRERDFYKAEYERYKRDEELRKEVVREVLESREVQSWIADAKSLLHRLKISRGAMPIILKCAIRMDPDYIFLPEEIQSGVTMETNRSYLKSLADKGLLWETQKKGRLAFRNRLRYWVTENVRKIKPGAPDEAIEVIYDELRKYVLT